METQQKSDDNVNVKCFQTFTHKGHLGCIEMLKAKAAIMFDRFCTSKAQQRKRGGKRQQ